ncbi:transcriptional regulator [Halobacteriales archaeon QS_8_69_26]|nr:MAG: transcriptional regulator [Halobacteriales archaeon QS_8_69_26]
MKLPTPDDLKERRKNLDLTQAELADLADVSQPLIARIEGDDVDPRLSTLRRIVNALETVEGDIVRAKKIMNEEVVSVAPDDSVAHAIDIMGEEGYSQLPVIKNDYPRGMISNADIRHADVEADLAEVPVDRVKSQKYGIAEPDDTLDEVDDKLDLNTAVIVVSNDRVFGIITEADVAARYS